MHYERVYKFALEVFNYDRDKTNSWWMTKVSELDNKSPYELVSEGKGKFIMKLLQRAVL